MKVRFTITIIKCSENVKLTKKSCQRAWSPPLPSNCVFDMTNKVMQTYITDAGPMVWIQRVILQTQQVYITMLALVRKMVSKFTYCYFFSMFSCTCTQHTNTQTHNKNTCTYTQHILLFFVQLLVAIEHVHLLNILHRDLKTQNVMMNRKRNILKIGDFGISKVLSSKITSAQTVRFYQGCN